MSNFAAHTPPDDSPNQWQSMLDHTLGVTDLAVKFGEPMGIEAITECAGLLHDVGKYSDDFQQYLRACHQAKLAGSKAPRAGSAEHKTAGAKMALGEKGDPIRVLVAACILGHHGGLPQAAESIIESLVRSAPKSERLDTAIARSASDIPELANFVVPDHTQVKALKELKEVATKDKSSAQCDMEMLIRLAFSCLVDADALDTERHFSPEVSNRRKTPRLMEKASSWLDALRNDVARMQAEASDGMVKQIRAEVFEACLVAGQLPPGLFTLTVPTGGGKTLSSLAFALSHAVKNQRSRIVYAIPYTSIIEQTAEVFRKILGDGAVVEHHSAMDWRARSGSGDDASQQQEFSWDQAQKLSTDNWDAPLIVTTTVQLFESLFSNRTSKCRKLHNLANSVIILDEVQSLPLALLTPLVSGLSALLRICNATIVLCTATQPAITGQSPLVTALPLATKIISDEIAAGHFKSLSRVTYRVETDRWDWEETATHIVSSKKSTLAVLNTKKDAMALLAATSNLARDGQIIRHLSTLMCGEHRRHVLEEAKVELDKFRAGIGPPVLLLSTQVIEAGVDINFSLVLRAKGPLDRMIQAAGRCNREGTLNKSDALVILFDPAEGSQPPGDYRTSVDVAWNQLTAPTGRLDLNSPTVAAEYFRSLYALVKLDKLCVQDARRAFDFPAVAEKVKLIPDDTVPVLVPYTSEISKKAKLSKLAFEELVSNIKTAGLKNNRISWHRWNEIQPLTVAIRHSDMKRHIDQTSIEELIEDQLYVWRAGYDAISGLGTFVGRAIEDLIN